ncbi:hypothetical protein B296_00046131 [Ensete ventricosum]|uniref:Uncharacterized protein n=1 Tax=Ensete ventricosum TaxID=4639 RepID=A0A426Z4Y8_ENSVE|nr:hypothetical protein B296_00046131 [Ensete ventricosum]
MRGLLDDGITRVSDSVPTLLRAIAEKDSRTNRGERRGDLSEEIDLSFPNKCPASLNRGFGGMWCVTRSRALQFALLPAYANPAPEQAESDRIEACGPTGRNR